MRYLYSKGDVDTPDRTVTPRRVRAKQQPQNLMANWQRIMGASLVNEFKVGYNLPHTSATAFGPAGYDPVGVSLSGIVHVLVDRRARHDGHRAQRPAHPRHERLVDHRVGVRADVAVLRERD